MILDIPLVQFQPQKATVQKHCYDPSTSPWWNTAGHIVKDDLVVGIVILIPALLPAEHGYCYTCKPPNKQKNDHVYTNR